MSGLIHFKNDAEILRNISDITGVPRDEIGRFVDGLKFKNSGGNPHMDYWRQFQAEFGVEPEISGTVYFHGCRCPRFTKFDQGLLPNHQAIDLIWLQLWQIVGDRIGTTNVEEMKARFLGEPGRWRGDYHDRLSRSIRERGPWGKLVRPEWFMDRTNSDYYLGNAPEIVSIILNHFSPDGVLHEIYRDETVPCIIHFKTTRKDALSLGHGLLYLRDKRHCRYWAQYTHHYGLDSMCGVAIPPEDILEVEYLD
ncbi:MAG: hypothetical protein H7Y06_12480 [Opitutaceae bacterium]|nr:hypothetical protein [Opitutaceae bacterium]